MKITVWMLEVKGTLVDHVIAERDGPMASYTNTTLVTVHGNFNAMMRQLQSYLEKYNPPGDRSIWQAVVDSLSASTISACFGIGDQQTAGATDISCGKHNLHPFWVALSRRIIDTDDGDTEVPR